ncbi:MAG: acetate uptake transporter [Mycobacterium leprae]
MADARDNFPPIGDPGPLGLAGFALTTFVLSFLNAGILPGEATPVFWTLALCYGGLAQLLAGMWEYRKNNTFGATAFCSYGAFWLSLGLMEILMKQGTVNLGASAGPALGVFLLGWTIFTFYMMIGSFRINGALSAVFVALFLAFAFLTLGKFTGVATYTHLGGYIGILTALLAWYASAATILNTTFGEVVLPVYPHKVGK